MGRIVEISASGRAPKNDPAIFLLALAASSDNEVTRHLALNALPQVARIGTHLFHFAAAVNDLRGWGRGLRRAIAKWYTERPLNDLAMQVLKYQQRDGWSHRDMLRLCHGGGVALKPEQEAVFEWVRTKGEGGFEERTVIRRKVGQPSMPVSRYLAADRSKLHPMLASYAELKAEKDPKRVISLIQRRGFTREMVPTEHLNNPLVWEALLYGDGDRGMPVTALVRNLGKMAAIDLTGPLSDGAKYIIGRLGDRTAIRKSRLHPIAILSALRVYAQGHGEKGKLTWKTNPQIVDALNDAFYMAFETIEPTGKNWLLGVDISGSMYSGEIAGMPGITPRVAAATMVMVTARSEKSWHGLGFTRVGNGFGVTPFEFTPNTRLDEVIKEMEAMPMGRTDYALPIWWATQTKTCVDTFAIYTDNETYAGPVHVHEAMKEYRKKFNPDAKLIAVAFTATEYSIAPQGEAGWLDVVGFDAGAPAIMADFSRGNLYGNVDGLAVHTRAVKVSDE